MAGDKGKEAEILVGGDNFGDRLFIVSISYQLCLFIYFL